MAHQTTDKGPERGNKFYVTDTYSLHPIKSAIQGLKNIPQRVQS